LEIYLHNPDVPEYYLTYTECGVCKVAKQEKLEFLAPSMCKMDYKTIALRGGKLIRTKTLASGGDCCDFYVCKKGSKWDKKEEKS